MTGPSNKPANMPNPKNGNGKMPLLPRWFATKGPRPYWLAEHWGLLLALVSTVVVAANTLITMPGISLTSEKWINAAVAWVASLALYLKDRQPAITKTAAWRQKVRDEEAAKKKPPA